MTIKYTDIKLWLELIHDEKFPVSFIKGRTSKNKETPEVWFNKGSSRARARGSCAKLRHFYRVIYIYIATFMGLAAPDKVQLSPSHQTDTNFTLIH